MSDERTRREALKTLAASAAATLVAGPGAATTVVTASAGKAPVFLSTEELEVVALLAERIIPADESSPGARAAGVAERIDGVLGSGSGKEKASWREGLTAIEGLCRERFGKSLRDVGDLEHDALLTTLAENEARPKTPGEHFFVALKSKTVDAYYTSEIGLVKELRYQGNTYLQDFPGCTHEKHRG